MSDITLLYHIILRWALVALSLAGVTLIFYYFACAFTKNKWCRIALVGILMFISIGAYVLNHRPNKVYYQKEDVLYIKPSG
jgi:uncharacterized membrane protein SirB2